MCNFKSWNPNNELQALDIYFGKLSFCVIFIGFTQNKIHKK